MSRRPTPDTREEPGFPRVSGDEPGAEELSDDG